MCHEYPKCCSVPRILLVDWQLGLDLTSTISVFAAIQPGCCFCVKQGMVDPPSSCSLYIYIYIFMIIINVNVTIIIIIIVILYNIFQHNWCVHNAGNTTVTAHALLKTPNLKTRLSSAREEFRAVW